MKIPNTARINAAGVNVHNSYNELFSFHIEEIGCNTHLQEFVRKLDDYLPQFVFSRKNLKRKKLQYSKGLTTQSPLDQARSLLQRTTKENICNSGELGELLLYLFAREVKGAKKLVSKIQARGSRTMTIPGRDYIFVVDEDADVYMLTGEAKMTHDSNHGLRSAQSDLNAFWESGNIEHEILLASSHLEDELTEKNVEKYEQYFLKGNPVSGDLKYKNVIFVGCSSEKLCELTLRKIEYSDFISNVISDLERCFANQRKLITASKKPNIYCFMPFGNVDEAREVFARHNKLIIE